MSTLRKQKKAFSLLELLVSFLLLTFVLSSLGYVLSQIHKEKKIDLQKPIENWIHAHSVLKKAFSFIPKELNQSSQDFFPCFFSNEDSSHKLIFSYQNGIDKDPLYSSLLLASLYYNKETNSLSLLSFPSPNLSQDSSIFREELLLDKIEDIQLDFFDPKQKCFVSTWGKENKSPPPIIFLKITFKNKKNLTFTFHTKGEFLISYEGAL